MNKLSLGPQTPHYLLFFSPPFFRKSYLWAISLSFAGFCTFIKGFIFFMVSVTCPSLLHLVYAEIKSYNQCDLPQFSTWGTWWKKLRGLLNYAYVHLTNSMEIFLCSIKSTYHAERSLASKTCQVMNDDLKSWQDLCFLQKWLKHDLLYKLDC